MNPRPREDREEISWWSSRHGKKDRRAAGWRQSRRITLVDLLLLTVMSGVLIPWAVHREGALELNSYRVRYRVRQRDGEFVITAKFSAVDENSPPDETVGLAVYSADERLLREEFDLVPPLGESREILLTAHPETAVQCRISVGEHSITRELTWKER